MCLFFAINYIILYIDTHTARYIDGLLTMFYLGCTTWYFMPRRLPRQAQRRAVLSSGAFGEARRLEADGHMKGFLNWLEDHWNPNESKLKTWGQQMPTLTQRGKKHAGFPTHNSFTSNVLKLLLLQHLLCLSSLLRTASTPACNYWKKLTCGVIPSFNLLELGNYTELSNRVK